VHKIDWTCIDYVIMAGKVAKSDRLGELGNRTTAITRIIMLTFHVEIFGQIDLFVNCSWVVTRWQ